MMSENDSNAEKLVRICLKNCGFERNLFAILEALEHKLYSTSEIEDDETASSRLLYEGIVLGEINVYSNGAINGNIGTPFTEIEIEWLDKLSTEDGFLIETEYQLDGEHELGVILNIANSPAKDLGKGIELRAALKHVRKDSTSFEVSVYQYLNASDNELIKRRLKDLL